MAIGLGAGVLLAAAGIYYAKNKETIDSSVKNFLSKFGDKSIAGLSPDDPFYNIKNKYSALGIDVDSPTDAKVADWLASWFKKDLNKAFPLTDEEVAAKSAEDILIKAGQSLSRIKRTKDATIRDGAYLCFDNDDVNRYQAFLPAMWNLKRQQKEGNGYTMNLEALSEIKVASSKKQFDTYVDMILDGSLGGYKNIKTRSAAIETAKNNYNNFALNMVQNEYQLKKLGFDSDDIKDTLTEKNAFLSRIKSLGYDAIVDDNDAGKLSRSPLILLNSSKVKVKSVQPIDSNLIKTSLENIKPMMGESYEDTFKSFDAWKQTPGVLIAIKNGIFQFDSELDKLASNNQ